MSYEKEQQKPVSFLNGKDNWYPVKYSISTQPTLGRIQWCVITQQFSTGSKAHNIPQKFHRLSRQNRPTWMGLFSLIFEECNFSGWTHRVCDGCKFRYEKNTIKWFRLLRCASIDLISAWVKQRKVGVWQLWVTHQRKFLPYGCDCWNKAG